MARGESSSSRKSQDTRLALLRAAERLFSEQGVYSTSLREVSAAAGQANSSAVAYHFGSRDELIDAILSRHSLPIHARWEAQLDLLERSGRVELRALMEMLALPLVAKLDDLDGGWEYISISAQLSVSPRSPLIVRPITQGSTVQRFIAATMKFHAAPPPLLPFHFERMANTIYASIVSFRRHSTEGTAPISRAAFENDLVDALMHIVQQPPSEETRKALAAKARPKTSKR